MEGVRETNIIYSIRGGTSKNLENYSREIVSQFSKLPGIVDLDTSLETGKPEVRVFIDRDKAADLGVDVASVAERFLNSVRLTSLSLRMRRRAVAMTFSKNSTHRTG